MSHNITNQAMNQARQQGLLTLAHKAQTDLFYLCHNILGYDKMTINTHLDLCTATANLLPTPPHSTPKSNQVGTPTNALVDQTSEAPTKNLGEELGVPSPDQPASSESGLYQAGISDTKNALGVQEATEEWDNRKHFLMLLMPRGTFKSSVVTIGFTLQMILNDQDIRVLIDSETFSKSKAFLAEIKGHLESNEKFRELYRVLYNSYPDDRKKDDLWSDSAINISARKRRRKEPTISCAGVDVTKTGMHYDLIIMDDLMSENNVTTKEQIEKVKQHYRLALSLLDPGKPLIVIGTRWHFLDVYQHILDNERHRFNILIRKAYNPNGALFFPEVLTQEFLDQTRQSQGSYIFSCQYLNEPVDEETAVFKTSYFVRKPLVEVQDLPINWYLSIDPSYEGPYSDYAALVIAGMDHQKQLYVRHVTRKKLTYSGIIEEIFELYNRYPVRQVILETVATQKSIQYELNNEQKRRGVWLPITEIRSRTKSKIERIRALAPYYEYGHVFHIKECPQLDELEYELLQFPVGQNDDCIDAFASILEYARPTANVERSQKRARVRRLSKLLDKPRSPLTGV